MRRSVVTAVLAAVVAGVLFGAGWVLWSRPGTAAAPKARQYLDVSACLLTGADGVTPGSPGAQAWQAMESASLASHVMVSYLPASRPSSVPAMLSTLVERRCGVIVVTDGSRAQVAAAADASPGRSFILVTGGAASGPAVVPANASVVPAASAAGRIDQEIAALAGTA